MGEMAGITSCAMTAGRVVALNRDRTVPWSPRPMKVRLVHTKAGRRSGSYAPVHDIIATRTSSTAGGADATGASELGQQVTLGRERAQLFDEDTGAAYMPSSSGWSLTRSLTTSTGEVSGLSRSQS